MSNLEVQSNPVVQPLNTLSKAQLSKILDEAVVAGKKAAKTYLEDKLGGVDTYPCGFAWTRMRGIRANSKLGKMLKELSFEKDWYSMAFCFDGSAFYRGQNLDAKEAGCIAASEVLSKHGFNAYVDTRID